MKKLILIFFILINTVLYAQGTLTENGKLVATIPQYNLSHGDTSYVLNINRLYSYKWLVYFQFANITGVKDATISVFCSGDNGTSWVAYPGFSPQLINSNGSFSFDDAYTIYDKLKFVLTVNSITGGSLNINQRLISNPNK